MNTEVRRLAARALRFAGLAVLVAARAYAQSGADVLSIGNVVVPEGATSVRVPVTLRDVPGTPLGIDRASGSRIDELAFEVVFPGECLSIADPYFDLRGGVLAHAHPLFIDNVDGMRSRYAFIYAGPRDEIAFTGGDDLLGELTFDVHACGPGPVYIHFDPDLTALFSVTNGSESYEEGSLVLQAGSIGTSGVPVATATPLPTRNPSAAVQPRIEIPATVPTASAPGLALLALGLAAGGLLLARRSG
jgi:hypothetical protein